MQKDVAVTGTAVDHDRHHIDLTYTLKTAVVI